MKFDLCTDLDGVAHLVNFELVTTITAMIKTDAKGNPRRGSLLTFTNGKTFWWPTDPYEVFDRMRGHV